MKVIYVSGPYRDVHGPWHVYQNVLHAQEVARLLWLAGAAVICPHTNTYPMDAVGTDDMILKGDLEILSRCDLAVMIGDWENSVGARAEFDLANKLGIPVMYWKEAEGSYESQYEKIKEWIRENDKGE